jgi:pyruvate dehydrogenase E2 component (dihydrolipoyllysine-residue acetyltransferase)
MADFKMPSLGSDMEAGTLVAWLVKPGDRVAKGDVVAEVETDKGIIEVEVFAPGVVERLVVAPDTRVPVGTVLAVIREDGEDAAAAPSAPAAAPERHVSPLARRRATELGVDVGGVAGTGEGGAVTAGDVERAAAARPAAADDATARMRKAIAAAMSRSKREIPHFYLATTIDLGRAARWLAETNEARPVPERILPVALLLKAVALALRGTPELNAPWAGDRAVPEAEIRLGVALSLRAGGLVAPAIAAADRLALPELMAAFADLVRRARGGKLTSSEFAGGTITVTSLGERGVDAVLPIIFPPQVAIVGFGRIAERPWVADGAVVARPLVQATLAVDHRAVDGHRAAAFLASVEERLQAPETL